MAPYLPVLRVNSLCGAGKRESDWWLYKEDPWTLIPSDVVPKFNEAGITRRVVSKILIDNPKKVLAF